jgi:hypothetical protein
MRRKKALKAKKPIERSKKPWPRSRSRPVGAAAKERRAKGGPQAVGRKSLSVAEYEAEKAKIRRRSKGICEICKINKAMDPDHVDARGATAFHAGGTDDARNLIDICRECHDMRKQSFIEGKLLYKKGPFGVVWWKVQAQDKWAYESGRYSMIASGFVSTVEDNDGSH